MLGTDRRQQLDTLLVVERIGEVEAQHPLMAQLGVQIATPHQPLAQRLLTRRRD
jgi:hypothetical protein